MNIFRYELRQYRKSLIGWCVGLTAFIALYMPFMPTFLDQSASFRDFFLNLGPTVLDTMGINPDLLFGSLGFYGYILTYVHLVCAIQAISLGINLFSKEVRMKTADFLLAKPKSRLTIFMQKWLAAFVSLLITQICFYIMSYVMMSTAAEGKLQSKEFWMVTVIASFVQWLFLSIGIFLALVVRRIKSPTTVSIGATMGLFLVGMIANMTKSDVLRVFAPLRYFDSNYVMMHCAYETGYLALALGLSALLTVAGGVIFVKRDILAG